jgi:ankyrin repeat protein
MLLYRHTLPGIEKYIEIINKRLVSEIDLVEKWRMLIDDVDFDEKIALHLLYMGYRDIGIIEQLTEYAASFEKVMLFTHLLGENDSPIRLPQWLLNAALIQAALSGKLTILKLALDNHADIHHDFDAAICLASKFGWKDCVEYLLLKGADVNADSGHPLCWSSRNGSESIVELLLNNGASVNIRNGCPLSWASEYGKHGVVELLMKNGAEIHQNEEYALRWASVRGHEKGKSSLIKDYSSG